MLSKIRSLLSAVSSWPFARRLGRWRREFLNYWFTVEKGNLAFFALLGLSVALLAAMVYFVYIDHLRTRWQQQRHANLACLARNVYHEARGEPFAGQIAVAEVTLNRVASRRFPATVCEVVYEKRFDSRRNRLVGAFSWTELDALAKPSGLGWWRAQRAAEAVYDRQQEVSVPDALFYHAVRIEPAWASEKKRVARIGQHIFYE
jgi:hypothetical protein